MIKKCEIKIIIVIFSLILLTIFISASETLNRNFFLKQDSIELSYDPVEIQITPPPNEEGTYLAGVELTFEIIDNDYKSVKIQLIGKTRAFPLTLSKSITGIWSAKWDTEQPSQYDDPVPPDTYEVELTIDGLQYNCNPDKIIITAGGPDILLIVIILIVIIGAVGGSAFLVITKKRSNKKDALEFGKVDKAKKKKKGKVYSGASSIGKRSGQIAETKTQSKTIDSEENQDQAKETSRIQKSSDTAPKQLMPADSQFKFETKASSSTFMMKDMESKMDLESKVKFLITKAESALQNVEFFKAILEQQDQEELKCPTCDKKMSQYWLTCPYCEAEQDDELALKHSMLEMANEVKYCPDCKRIIKQNWIECPYCFTKQ